MNKYNFYFISI